MKYLKNILILAGVLSVFATLRGRRLAVSRYKVHSSKIRGRLRIALLSDLHSFNHGSLHDPQSKLVKAIDDNNPDLVVMTGDIADHIIPHFNTKVLLRKLGKYPVFYATGNHEYKSGEIREIKRFFRDLGANVLEGVNRKIQIRGNKINICGIDDAIIGAERFKAQLLNCAGQADMKNFTILLTHRPEKVKLYRQLKFDLILTGHTHGGTVIIPRFFNGIYAVNQGFLPKYAGGLYDVGRGNMVVSRGLSKSSRGLPRVFNRPELVIVDVCEE
ncbi:MAG: metallophosphoesterase [Oscillospiraceae bacterium]|jgi:predicted MPP superfamily phosphohydrolase|nr:metallophosphoesterase [Oscillospiraceae bacterium]